MGSLKVQNAMWYDFGLGSRDHVIRMEEKTRVSGDGGSTKVVYEGVVTGHVTVRAALGGPNLVLKTLSLRAKP